MIQFTDTGIMDGQPRMTPDGYLVASARVARTGVQVYNRSELGLEGAGTINVYRPPEAVFSKDSLKTYAFKPTTINHPSENVTSKTWKQDSAGHMGGDVLRDGEYVKVPFVLMDAAAIEAANTTHKQISMGYMAEIVMKDGIAPDGTAYEAVQDKISINHMAFVPLARGGAELRIGDSADNWGASPVMDRATDQPKGNPMPDNLQKVMFDGISIETTDQGAQAIGKLQGLLKDAATALDTAKATNDAAIAAKDAEIAKRDAEIDALKAKVLGDADIDKKIADRGDLIAVATAIVADVKTAGVPDADIKKAVVVAKRGAACADKSAAYIDAAFDILADEARATMDAQDQVRSALGGIIVPTVADKAVVDARAAMIAELHSGKAN